MSQQFAISAKFAFNDDNGARQDDRENTRVQIFVQLFILFWYSFFCLFFWPLRVERSNPFWTAVGALCVVGPLRVKFKLNVVPGARKFHNIAKLELVACLCSRPRPSTDPGPGSSQEATYSGRESERASLCVPPPLLLLLALCTIVIRTFSTLDHTLAAEHTVHRALYGAYQLCQQTTK